MALADAEPDPEPLALPDAEPDPEPLALAVPLADAEAEPLALPEPDPDALPLTEPEDSPISRTCEPSSLPVHAAAASATAATAVISVPSSRLFRSISVSLTRAALHPDRSVLASRRLKTRSSRRSVDR